MYKWLTLLLFSANLFASPISHLTKIGEGEMEYLFWTIYQAQFYRAGSNASSSTPLEEDHPAKALKIEYYQSITRQALLDATIEQWQHLGYSPSQIQSWAKPLASLWPDIKPGDTLTVLVSKEGASHFFFQNQRLGSIDDKQFGQAFLSIWLSEQTTEPELRLQLLGLTQ
jgi:hypothetical protein